MLCTACAEVERSTQRGGEIGIDAKICAQAGKESCTRFISTIVNTIARNKAIFCSVVVSRCSRGGARDLEWTRQDIVLLT